MTGVGKSRNLTPRKNLTPYAHSVKFFVPTTKRPTERSQGTASIIMARHKAPPGVGKWFFFVSAHRADPGRKKYHFPNRAHRPPSNFPTRPPGSGVKFSAH